MSKLQYLIDRLCPDGVEYIELGKIGKFENTGVDKKVLADEKKVVLLNYMDIYRNKYIDKKIPTMIVTASDKKITTCTVEKGDIFITPTSEKRGDIG